MWRAISRFFGSVDGDEGNAVEGGKMNPAIVAFDLIERLFTDRETYKKKKQKRIAEDLIFAGCVLTSDENHEDALALFQNAADLLGVNLLVVFGQAGLILARKGKTRNDYRQAIKFLKLALAYDRLSRIDKAILEDTLEYLANSILNSN